MAFLEAVSLRKSFGALVALNDVSFALEEGKLYGIIGPNGSGKSTLVNLVTGVLKPTSGKIHLDGVNIAGKSPHHISRAGIARTFQAPRVFPDLTVSDNVVAYHRSKDGVGEILELVGLTEVKDTKAMQLGFGQRKELELARVIALDPKVVFLDEPLAGLDVAMIRKISSLLRILNHEFGKTVVVIEHNLDELMELASYVFVLDHGEKIEEGNPSVIRKSAAVHDAYFGD